MVAGDSFRQPHHRIGGFALFDLSLTVVAAVGIAYWRPWSEEHKLILAEVLLVFFMLWIIAIIAHVVFKQKTMSSYKLGLSDKPDVMKDLLENHNL